MNGRASPDKLTKSRCAVCYRAVSFGRKTTRSTKSRYCALCEAERRCAELERTAPNPEPVVVYSVRSVLERRGGVDLVRQLRSRFAHLPRQQRASEAWKWLYLELCKRTLALHEDRLNDVIRDGFLLDSWEFYADLISEYKVYLTGAKMPMMHLRPAWKPMRPLPGSFEGGRRR